MPDPTGSRSPLVRAGDWLFRWRNLLFPLAFFAIVFVSRPRFPMGSLTADLTMDLVGIAVTVLGQAVRAGVVGLVYVPRGGRDRRVHADTLVRDGAFAHCRNPLYVGNFLVFLGLFIILNSWAGWLIGVPAVMFAYRAIVATEERFLRGRFGAEYEEYCRQVSRFRPSLRGLRDTLRRHRFDWLRVIRKEYGQAFTWMTAIVLLLVWERTANGLGDRVREQWPAFGGAWLVIVLAYGVTRVLKKTGRLRLS